MEFMPLLAESSGEKIVVLAFALLIGGGIIAAIAMIPLIGPFLAIALVFGAVSNTCDRRKGCSQNNQKDHSTYVVKLQELNPYVDQVLKYPEAEIRINYQR